MALTDSCQYETTALHFKFMNIKATGTRKIANKASERCMLHFAWLIHVNLRSL
jgi:hypothetical protein